MGTFLYNLFSDYIFKNVTDQFWKLLKADLKKPGSVRDPKGKEVHSASFTQEKKQTQTSSRKRITKQIFLITIF